MLRISKKVELLAKLNCEKNRSTDIEEKILSYSRAKDTAGIMLLDKVITIPNRASRKQYIQQVKSALVNSKHKK